MVDHWTDYVLLAAYVTILLTMALYGLHRYHLVWLYLRHKAAEQRSARQFGESELPRVTVQLPMFNEGAVGRRVIDAACRIDYPRDKLQIQVLDDSTDGSESVSRAATEAWAGAGLDITLSHRAERTGYKAGALAAGLGGASGELVAIFDADFVPPPDVLRNVVDQFTDAGVGLVQVRWDHLNRDASRLTRSQAIFLDGHFVIEHTARNRSGRFMHFNGTAGVWRRRAIDEAGGWQHDTLTEDLDLSYRAQLLGWRFVYLPQHVAPAELPPEMAAFKQQAHRWTKGSMQCAVKLLPRILRAPLPWRVKAEAFFHLTNTLVYPLMVVLTVLIYPAFIAAQGPLKEYRAAGWLFAGTMFLLATCGAGTFFVFAQRELFGRRVGWRTLAHLPSLMALGVGISLSNARAVIEALVQDGRSRGNEFVRTPKYGDASADKAWQGVGGAVADLGGDSLKWWARKLPMPVLEIAFGCYMLAFIAISVRYGFALGSLPFTVLFAAGYFYVGVGTLHALYRQRHPVRALPEPGVAR